MSLAKLLTAQQVADLLVIQPTSLFDARYRERIGLPVVRIGRLLRFAQADVEQLVKRGQRPVRSGA